MPQVRAVKPQGTYLAWLEVSDAMERVGATPAAAAAAAADDTSSLEAVFQRYLVEHAHIHINPGSSYGLGGSGRMRMNVATSRQLVEIALTNMAAALASG
jgi:cystathionine beta-lyase